MARKPDEYAVMSQDLSALFANMGDSSPTAHRVFGVVFKRKQPLLYLPLERNLSAHSLDLYPAQRLPARTLKALMRCVCRVGGTRLLPRRTIRIPLDAPLSRLLRSLTTDDRLPNFAVLAGNPKASGRRYIFLAFDLTHKPAAVVKAGEGDHALRLIQRETEFLKAVPTGTLGIPRLKAVLRSGAVQAFALDYAEGEPPPETPSPQMTAMLGSWVDTRRMVSAAEVPCWRRLLEAVPHSSKWQRMRQRVEAVQLHPALFHGDFTPWNIKVSRKNGDWRVLDWERGELVGLPCWDWYHYRIQVATLVYRLSIPAHVSLVEQWLHSEFFRAYAVAARAWSIHRELLLTYLLYTIVITRPTEGLQFTRELLDVLAQRWQIA